MKHSELEMMDGTQSKSSYAVVGMGDGFKVGVKAEFHVGKPPKSAGFEGYAVATALRVRFQYTGKETLADPKFFFKQHLPKVAKYFSTVGPQHASIGIIGVAPVESPSTLATDGKRVAQITSALINSMGEHGIEIQQKEALHEWLASLLLEKASAFADELASGSATVIDLSKYKIQK